MEITHEVLIELGFSIIPNRPLRYAYKGVTGRLTPDLSLFEFHGFSLPITRVADLRYMLWIIDYRDNASFEPYPNDVSMN